jgi:hypothetical protein
MKYNLGRSYPMNLTPGFQTLGAALLYTTNRQRVKTCFGFLNYQAVGRTLFRVAMTSINLHNNHLTYEGNNADSAPTHGDHGRISGNEILANYNERQ